MKQNSFTKLFVVGMAAGLFLVTQLPAKDTETQPVPPKKEAVATVEKKDVAVEKEVLTPKKEVVEQNDVSVVKAGNCNCEKKAEPCCPKKEACPKPQVCPKPPVCPKPVEKTCPCEPAKPKCCP